MSLSYSYIFPLLISILFFTILKIEDINNAEKVFTKDKLTYLQSILLCFIPLLNIIIVLGIVKTQFFD